MYSYNVYYLPLLLPALMMASSGLYLSYIHLRVLLRWMLESSSITVYEDINEANVL